MQTTELSFTRYQIYITNQIVIYFFRIIREVDKMFLNGSRLDGRDDKTLNIYIEMIQGPSKG